MPTKEEIERIKKILKQKNADPEIEFLGTLDNGDKVYKAIQHYPYMVELYDPISFKKIVYIFDKDGDGNIIKDIIRYA